MRRAIQRQMTLRRSVLVAVALLCLAATASAGQLGSLVSPGRLAKAHAALEGAGNCAQCHEAGKKVTPARCLTCHKPIADRIARKTGVHRKVTDQCVTCHVEHAGVNGELRHLDTRTFDHAAETGYALEGQHARTAANCAACHTQRSFLEARTTCSSCHADVHKGALGAECTRCHTTKAPFKESGRVFDHTTARFPLTGAHREVACEKCHKRGVFRGTDFGTCATCHQDPHRRKFGAACTACHTTDKWETCSVEHSKTGFRLVGAHAEVACIKCHQSGSMTEPLRFDRCSACHVNVHRASIREDCRACHNETTFRDAPFDHFKRTAFALEGRHDGLTCRKCHTGISAGEVPLARRVVDFRGAVRACVSCHGDQDPHKGEFGRACDACHRPATFRMKEFRHPRAPEFYAGGHEKVSCEKCHVPGKALRPTRTGAAIVASAWSPPPPGKRTDAPPKGPSMECATCHTDVHLGQVGPACERCHAVDGLRFAAVKFSHARSSFPLTGKHQSVECVKCHRTEERTFPSGSGKAMVLNPMGTQCQACHKDPHLGQIDTRCETCHQTDTFAVSKFTHRGMEDFFKGFHGQYACAACHKTETGRFPAGQGTAMRFQVGRTCAACHPQF
jgi:hypothetical protein